MPVCPVGSACSALSSIFPWRLETPGAGELRGGQATQTQLMVEWGEPGLGARPRAVLMVEGVFLQKAEVSIVPDAWGQLLP